MASSSDENSEDEPTEPRLLLPTEPRLLFLGEGENARRHRKRKLAKKENDDGNEAKYNKKARFWCFLRDDLEAKWVVIKSDKVQEMRIYDDEPIVSKQLLDQALMEVALCEDFNRDTFKCYIEIPFVNKAIKNVFSNSSFYRPILDDEELKQFFDDDSPLNSGMRKFMTFLNDDGTNMKCQNGLPSKTAANFCKDLQDTEREAIRRVSTRGLNSFIQSIFKIFSGGAFCKDSLEDLESFLPTHLQVIRRYKELVSSIHIHTLYFFKI
jgi:hypothetical protein